MWHCHILEHEEHDMMRPLVVHAEAVAVQRLRRPRSHGRLRGASLPIALPSRAPRRLVAGHEGGSAGLGVRCPDCLRRSWSRGPRFLGGVWVTWRVHGAGRSPPQGRARVLYWVDPMHPSYKSDKPGIAPDCGMRARAGLRRRRGRASGSSTAARLVAGSRGAGSRFIGVRVGQAARSSARRGTIRTSDAWPRTTTGSIGWSAAATASSANSSRIAAGSLVRKDQLLLTFYSSRFARRRSRHSSTP